MWPVYEEGYGASPIHPIHVQGHGGPRMSKLEGVSRARYNHRPHLRAGPVAHPHLLAVFLKAQKNDTQRDVQEHDEGANYQLCLIQQGNANGSFAP